MTTDQLIVVDEPQYLLDEREPEAGACSGATEEGQEVTLIAWIGIVTGSPLLILYMQQGCYQSQKTRHGEAVCTRVNDLH